MRHLTRLICSLLIVHLPASVMAGDSLTVLSLNLAHGRGDALNQLLVSDATIHANLARVATLLTREQADIVALQEADGPSRWSGGFDHVAELAQLAGYPYSFRGSHADSWLFDYGTALLSQPPLDDARSHRFAPSPPTAGKGFVLAQQLALDAETPVQGARAGLLGPTVAEAQRSLALKLWLIQNARHSINLNYYIFKRDRIGLALLGALCNAVQRGVDIHVTVDSMGSISPGHPDLRALATCADDAGYVVDADGRPTPHRARVQAVVFNALTRLNLNRRSHDKLLVVDGDYPDRAVIITGGRNVSLDYYGYHEDGSTDPTTFRDMEIALRPSPDKPLGSLHLGALASFYYTVLFDYRGNRHLTAVGANDFDDHSHLPVTDTAAELYRDRRRLA